MVRDEHSAHSVFSIITHPFQAFNVPNDLIRGCFLLQSKWIHNGVPS